jgi:hypothetical protein
MRHHRQLPKEGCRWHKKNVQRQPEKPDWSFAHPPWYSAADRRVALLGDQTEGIICPTRGDRNAQKATTPFVG